MFFQNLKNKTKKNLFKAKTVAVAPEMWAKCYMDKKKSFTPTSQSPSASKRAKELHHAKIMLLPRFKCPGKTRYDNELLAGLLSLVTTM
jgi:hypothetical protein